MSDLRKISVLLADDTPIARAGISSLLDGVSDIVILGEAATAQEVPLCVLEKKPDVLLLDLNWFDDESAGETAIRQIKKISPQTRIVAISAYKHLIERARRAGAEAALNKGISKSELLSAIRSVYNSPVPVVESLPAPEMLSERENQVLELMAQGKTAKEIARDLQIEEPTVRHHMTSIREKLGAANNPQAVAIAYQQNLLPTGSNTQTREN